MSFFHSITWKRCWYCSIISPIPGILLNLKEHTCSIVVHVFPNLSSSTCGLNNMHTMFYQISFGVLGYIWKSYWSWHWARYGFVFVGLSCINHNPHVQVKRACCGSCPFALTNCPKSSFIRSDLIISGRPYVPSGPNMLMLEKPAYMSKTIRSFKVNLHLEEIIYSVWSKKIHALFTLLQSVERHNPIFVIERLSTNQHLSPALILCT